MISAVDCTRSAKIQMQIYKIYFTHTKKENEKSNYHKEDHHCWKTEQVLVHCKYQQWGKPDQVSFQFHLLLQYWMYSCVCCSFSYFGFKIVLEQKAEVLQKPNFQVGAPLQAYRPFWPLYNPQNCDPLLLSPLNIRSSTGHLNRA